MIDNIFAAIISLAGILMALFFIVFVILAAIWGTLKIIPEITEAWEDLIESLKDTNKGEQGDE